MTALCEPYKRARLATGRTVAGLELLALAQQRPETARPLWQPLAVRADWEEALAGEMPEDGAELALWYLEQVGRKTEARRLDGVISTSLHGVLVVRASGVRYFWSWADLYCQSTRVKTADCAKRVAARRARIAAVMAKEVA